MTARPGSIRYQVRLSVPRRGSWRTWGAVSGNFEHRLAEQESAAVIGPCIEGETRRGRDYVRVTLVMTIGAPDIAQALTAAWLVFRKAAGSDSGWDMASATAEVRPGGSALGHLPEMPEQSALATAT
jgi:hypothetical protein